MLCCFGSLCNAISAQGGKNSLSHRCIRVFFIILDQYVCRERFKKQKNWVSLEEEWNESEDRRAKQEEKKTTQSSVFRDSFFLLVLG